MSMGGGSVMRAAAKVAGIGVGNTGLRGGVVPETSISAAARAAARPIGAIAGKSSCDGVKAIAAIDAPSVEKPVRAEFDDWEFAGSDEEVLSGSGDPLPRLVFGGAPTIEEAKVATTELKDALEKAFVSSPKSSGYESVYGAGHSSALSQLSNSEVVQYNASLASAPSTKHAIQAFRLLDQSPEVQGVVASIASDPNVWDAVLRNPALQGYLRSQSATSTKVYQNVGESLAQGDIHYQEPPKSFEAFFESGKPVGNETSLGSETGKSHAGESNSKNEFLNIWNNIKLSVVDMMSGLSDFFNSLFGVQGDNKVAANTNPFPAVLENYLGPSLLGVVVMVIMVVVLKRA